MSTFLELAKSRYSVRSFTSQPVEHKKLVHILEAARAAPTACNNQPQRIKVIAGDADLAKLDECTPRRFNAQMVLLVCYDKSVCWVHPTESHFVSGEIDASIAATHLMMATLDVGLGCCWVMKFERAKTSEVFELPKNIVPVTMLMIGYPAEDAAPSALHGQRVPLENILL